MEVCNSTSWSQMEPQLDRVTGMMGNMEVLVTDGGPPYSSNEFAKYMKRRGIRHHTCTPESPQSNGFVEIFQKVLVKIVHTATVEKQDPKKAVDRYLMAYRAAPHKTTGKSPYEMLFGRKMKTQLPQMITSKDNDIVRQARKKHNDEKIEQKEKFDKRKKVKTKEVNKGDDIMIQQQKTTVKTPWDPKPYKVVKTSGSKVTAMRGEEVKERSKSNIKVVKQRPADMIIKNTGDEKKHNDDDDFDLDVSWGKIMAMGEANEQEEQVRQEEEDEDQEDADLPAQDEDEEDADLPALPSSASEEENEEEEREEEGRQPQRARADEADSLLDSLHGGSYWTVAEGGRARRRTTRLQEEQERAPDYWEHNLAKEMSEGERGPRHLTPESSPRQGELTHEELEELPGQERQELQVCREMLDLEKTPMENLFCLYALHPPLTGEDEPERPEAASFKTLDKTQ